MTSNGAHSVLGKGLGSLIPSKDGSRNYWGPTISTVSESEKVMSVPVEMIKPNPYQPRKNFDAEQLTELAASIKEYGIVQPLIVTLEAPGVYQLIAGERRLQAAKRVNLTHVPVIVREAQDQKKLEISLIENVQRHDLNAVEEAVSYRRLMDEFNLTQEEVAQRVGRSRSSIANFVRLLALPREILESIETGEITFSHAKIILSYETETEQLKAFHEIQKKGLTVAQASRPVVRVRAHTRTTAQDPVLASWEDRLTTRLGFSSRIKKNIGGGVVEISFTTEEDLKTLLDKLLD